MGVLSYNGCPHQGMKKRNELYKEDQSFCYHDNKRDKHIYMYVNFLTIYV